MAWVATAQDNQTSPLVGDTVFHPVVRRVLDLLLTSKSPNSDTLPMYICVTLTFFHSCSYWWQLPCHTRCKCSCGNTYLLWQSSDNVQLCCQWQLQLWCACDSQLWKQWTYRISCSQHWKHQGESSIDGHKYKTTDSGFRILWARQMDSEYSQWA